MHLAGQSKPQAQLRLKGRRERFYLLMDRAVKSHELQRGMDTKRKTWDPFCKQSTIRHHKDGIPEKTHRFQTCTLNIKGHMGKRKKKERLGQRTQNLCKALIKTIIDTQGNNLVCEGRQLIVAGACYGWYVIRSWRNNWVGMLAALT